MTEVEAGKQLDGILASLGVSVGDTIMLGIDMSKLPLPGYPAELNREAFRKREEKWCSFVFEHLMDAIGVNGTLLVPTYSYSCSRPGSTFVCENTPSETGPFTDFFRRKDGVFRSIHPIFSIAGLGPAAKAILGETGNAAFGMESSFARFTGHDVKFLCLGVEIRHCVTYLHHLEQLYGTPHRYNKSFAVDVHAGGVNVPGPWFAYMGYRGLGYESDFSSLQHELRARGTLREVIWNEGFNHIADASAVYDAGMSLLRENVSAFLNRNLSFTFSDIPDVNPESPGTTVLTICCDDVVEDNS